MNSLTLKIPIICSDGIIFCDVNQMLSYSYFNDVINNMMSPNKLHCDIKISNNLDIDVENAEIVRTHTDTINECTVEYNIRVPAVYVKCTCKIFNILLQSEKYYLPANNYNEDIVDLLIYNDVYNMGLIVEYNTWGFDASEYISLVIFIKEKLPDRDPYDVLIKGNFTFASFLIGHAFKLAGQGLLNDSIIPDTLRYTRKLLRSRDISYECRVLLYDILDTIIRYHVEYAQIIIEQINDDTIQRAVNTFTREIGIDHSFMYDKSERLTFNKALNDLQIRLTKMHELGIISAIDCLK